MQQEKHIKMKKLKKLNRLIVILIVFFLIPNTNSFSQNKFSELFVDINYPTIIDSLTYENYIDVKINYIENKDYFYSKYNETYLFLNETTTTYLVPFGKSKLEDKYFIYMILYNNDESPSLLQFVYDNNWNMITYDYISTKLDVICLDDIYKFRCFEKEKLTFFYLYNKFEKEYHKLTTEYIEKFIDEFIESGEYPALGYNDINQSKKTN